MYLLQDKNNLVVCLAMSAQATRDFGCALLRSTKKCGVLYSDLAESKVSESMDETLV